MVIKMAKLLYSDFYAALNALSVTVEIQIHKDSKLVIIHAPLYMKKKSTVSWCYGLTYTQEDIFNDPQLRTMLATRYGIIEASGYIHK